MSKVASMIATMSSLELVEVINEIRVEEGRAELRHDNFMAKVEKHPGIDALKFKGVYVGGNGQERPCFYLPKFECELMVMSESLMVQTRVLKRLKALEEEADKRREVRVDSSTAYRVMSEMVVEARGEAGKSCKSYHFSNEALMLNEIIFGVRTAIDRDSLSQADLAKLTKMEMRNAVLIGRGLSYADRKDLLKKYYEQMLLTPPPKDKLLKEKRV